MTSIYLDCGCRANSEMNGLPYCAIHLTAEQKPAPDLSGRLAKCSEGCKITASNIDLPFFQFRGEGSLSATETCRCGYHLVAHTPEVRERNPRLKCSSFEPRGAWPHDTYFCGCRGWD